MLPGRMSSEAWPSWGAAGHWLRSPTCQGKYAHDFALLLEGLLVNSQFWLFRWVQWTIVTHKGTGGGTWLDPLSYCQQAETVFYFRLIETVPPSPRVLACSMWGFLGLYCHPVAKTSGSDVLGEIFIVIFPSGFNYCHWTLMGALLA